MKNSPDIVLVYMTTSNKDEAKRIGQTLVQERLCACVNIIDGMESIYHWQGKVESAQEAILIAKTAAENFDALKERVLQLHSYENPCILQIDIPHGASAYLNWVKSESARR